MCTVAVVCSGDGGYRLGHNRDERIHRPRGTAPALRTAGGARYLAPADPEGGGTWLAVNDRGATVCILNAAERDPSRLPSTPRSRGRVVLDLAGTHAPGDLREYRATHRDELRATRSFHLVLVAPGAGAPEVVRVGWDGETWDQRRMEPPCLFVSCLPFPVEAERARSRSFEELLGREPQPPTETLAAWLANHDPEPGAQATEGLGTGSNSVATCCQPLPSLEASTLPKSVAM